MDRVADDVSKKYRGSAFTKFSSRSFSLLVQDGEVGNCCLQFSFLNESSKELFFTEMEPNMNKKFSKWIF